MKKIYILLILSILITSCVKEDYYGKSSYGNIKELLVSNQAGNAVIDGENYIITVEIPGGVDLTTISIQKITVSSFAVADKSEGDILDLNESAVINVTSEDGIVHQWTVNAFIASSTPQLDNGNLDLWYQSASEYYEPGESESTTIWGTSNPGTNILNKIVTVPEDFGNGDYGANIVTLDNGLIGSTFGAPISTGSIYTGKFNFDNLDPSDPEAAIDFGTPFGGRPEKLRIDYSYVPGEENQDKDGNPLSYGDACDIYALLELRISGNTQRLATAWFRSSDLQEDMLTIEVTFNYGELDDTFPDYMKPTEHGYVSADSAAYVLPTHITFVASSSFDGANFAGAEGSRLIINNVVMVYDENSAE